jgi:hypothetical protein
MKARSCCITELLAFVRSGDEGRVELSDTLFLPLLAPFFVVRNVAPAPSLAN